MSSKYSQGLAVIYEIRSKCLKRQKAAIGSLSKQSSEGLCKFTSIMSSGQAIHPALIISTYLGRTWGRFGQINKRVEPAA
ncbi:MAG: hypothetical protein WBJ77_04175, partial [Bacillota bacterium]